MLLPARPCFFFFLFLSLCLHLCVSLLCVWASTSPPPAAARRLFQWDNFCVNQSLVGQKCLWRGKERETEGSMKKVGALRSGCTNAPHQCSSALVRTRRPTLGCLLALEPNCQLQAAGLPLPLALSVEIVVRWKQTLSLWARLPLSYLWLNWVDSR